MSMRGQVSSNSTGPARGGSERFGAVPSGRQRPVFTTMPLPMFSRLQGSIFLTDVGGRVVCSRSVLIAHKMLLTQYMDVHGQFHPTTSHTLRQTPNISSPFWAPGGQGRGASKLNQIDEQIRKLLLQRKNSPSS